MYSKHSFICRVFIVVFISWVPFNTISAESVSNTHITIRLATGMKGGTYYKVASFAKRINANKNIQIEPISTNGSWESLLLLREGRAEFAFSQWDAVQKYCRWTQDSSIMAISPLYMEYLHIIVREPLELLDISELRGKKLFLGPTHSGTAITSVNLLEVLGVSHEEYQDQQITDLTSIPRLLRKDSLDVVMYVGPLGNEFVRNILKSTPCHLFSLNMLAKKRIGIDIKGKPQLTFEVSEIPPNTYRGQIAPVATVAVPSVLMSLRNIPPFIILKVDTLIGMAIDSIRMSKSRIILQPPTIMNVLQNKILYFDKTIWSNHYSVQRYWLNIAIPIVILVIIIVLQMKYIDIIRYSRFRFALILMIVTIFICLLSATGIYSLEHSVNANFESLPETGWSMLIYITSGLSDRGPITSGGRILGAIFLISGSILTIVLTGFLASNFVIKALEKKMTSNLKNHYVILNWSARTLEVIRQIHSELQHSFKNVVVVVSDDPKLDLDKLQRRFDESASKKAFENVYFYPGNPCDEMCLLNTNVEYAKTILIMADDKSSLTSDEKTIRSLFTLQKIAEEHNIKMHVVAEILNIENVSIIENIASHFPGTVDSVVSGYVRTLLLAQATIIPGLTKFYKDLLYFSSDTNELYLLPISESAIGMTFPDYSSRFISKMRKQPIIPVGLFRYYEEEPKLVTNPKPYLDSGEDNPFYVLENGDKLLVIAYEAPSPEDIL